MCVWCGSQDPALCTMDYDLFRCLACVSRPLLGVSIRHSPEFAQAVPGMKAACGELAAMIRMPSFSHIRPN
jgi:hypothetical protein